MSRKSSLREELERRVADSAKSPDNSGSSAVTRVLLLPADAIDQPVGFVRLLATYGLSLRKGREVLEMLATGHPAIVDLKTSRPSAVLSDLAKLGVLGAEFSVPEVDVKKVREEQQLSQSDFAKWYGLEVDTVRNWEQGRYEPDGPAKVLLNVINHEPDAIRRALIRQLLTKRAHHGTADRLQQKIAALLRPGQAVDGIEPHVPPPDGYVWVLQRREHTD